MKCCVPGCEREAQRREWCNAHYISLGRKGEIPLVKPRNVGLCVAEGCDRRATKRKLCAMHYMRQQRHGDASTVKKAAAGAGCRPSNGYARITIDGRRDYEHIFIAERALGRRLPRGVEVHHVDLSRSNNANENLVICPDKAYHDLLHLRTDAFNACGDPDLRRCKFCGRFDDPGGMVRESGKFSSFSHGECRNAAQRDRRKRLG